MSANPTPTTPTPTLSSTPTTPTMLPYLQGRVVSRLQQFVLLPEAAQREILDLEVYLTNHQTVIFSQHHVKLVKSVRGVRVKELVDRIDAWLQDKQPTPTNDAPTTDAARPASPVPVLEAPTTAQANAGLHPSFASVADSLPPLSPEITKRQQHALNLLEGLIFHGFITPYKENHDELLQLKDTDLLVPLSISITAMTTRPNLTVWQVLPGALFAASVKRKGGLLASVLPHGGYAIVNALLATLTLFKTDVGRKPIAVFDLKSAKLEVGANDDDANANNSVCVRVWDADKSEVLDVESPTKRDAFVEAMMGLGALLWQKSASVPSMSAPTEPNANNQAFSEEWKASVPNTTDQTNTNTNDEQHQHQHEAPAPTADAVKIASTVPGAMGPQDTTVMNVKTDDTKAP